MTANGNGAPTTRGNTSLYYADTFAHFGTDGEVRHQLGIWVTDGAAQYRITPASPIFDLNHTAIQDASGYVGWVYGGDPATDEEFNGNRLRAGQLEPFPSALQYTSPGATPYYMKRDQGQVDFVAEFALEFLEGTDSDVGFLFNGTTCNGTDAGTIGYLLNFKSNSLTATLYSVATGSFTSLITGTSPSPPYTANDLNRWHWKVKISSVAGVITATVNGLALLTYDTGGVLTGTICGFRSYQSNYLVRGLSLRKADTVTISGVTNGDAVSLHGAGKLPAISGTASGSSIVLTHTHFPLSGVQINGTYYSQPLWGGDEYETPT